IVFAYDCPSGCPDVVAALSGVFDGMSDPLCLSMPGQPPARAVLTPDPQLPTPITASAWGATYTATCIDVPSLRAFANAHYAQGPEQRCAEGYAVPDCGGGTGGSGAGGGNAGDAGGG